jgi:hypothetical protein
MVQLKLRMEAQGTVQCPDGTIKHIVLRAERPLTEEEKEKYCGDNPGNSSSDSSQERSL